MTNPTLTWQLLQLDPDTDAPRLMQNFEALQDFLLLEVVHRHHVQFVSFDIPALAVAASAEVTGLSFLQAFPAGVVPWCFVQQNSPGTTVAGVVQVTFYPHDITNTGLEIRCTNPGSAAASAAPGGGRVLAFDTSFDTSL